MDVKLDIARVSEMRTLLEYIILQKPRFSQVVLFFLRILPILPRREDFRRVVTSKLHCNQESDNLNRLWLLLLAKIKRSEFVKQSWAPGTNKTKTS